MNGFATQTWEQQRIVLTDANAWELTSDAYAHVNVLWLGYADVDFGAGVWINDAGIAAIGDAIRSVQAAMAALAELGGLRGKRHEELMQRDANQRVRNLPED